MVSVQERLKLKRAQIDTWSIREQLCLASSVLRSGDQNWMSVSRSLKAFGDSGRPADWFSQKSCAVQYSSLLENVETPKRKKRTDKGDTSVDTPSESIVRRLTQERIDELKRLLNEDRHIYAKLKEDVMLVKSGCADDKLNDMCQEIEEEKRQKERKAEAHERWLKEREEKKVELERAWKPPVAPASPHRRKHHPKIHRRNSSQSEPSSEAESALDSPLSEPLNVDVIGEENVQETSVEPKPSQTPTSPLLTSLLKSPSPAPTSSQGSSILHSAITSHRGASPTITSLLSSAPGVPGASNMVTVVPPTAVSSSLKNLVSSAISSEQPHHQPPPHNPSPAAGAPTLSMLLELPPSLPGKPLPELPSAAKTTSLPPSTAIVSAAVTPSTTTPKVIAVRGGTSAVASTSSPKIVTSVPASSSTSTSSEVQAASQEIKVADSTSKDEDIEVLHVDSSQNSVDAQQMPIETKEELIEEVLIEEVVVNDDSVIESELLSSQISDVVVATEQEDIKEKHNKEVDQIKFEEQIIEVSQSTDVSTQKEDTKAEMVADIDSTSNNTSLPVNVENTSNSEEKNAKEECIEAIIDTSSQELVSEMVTEETAALEVVPATEAELTSGAVAEVIEITEDQESTIQTEVVGECEPCMQELEDMEVIILDKVQGLDEVQIVEDMKELECEVVEVVMGAQEKVEDEVKEDTEELMHDDLKHEEVTAVDTSSEDDIAVECKDTDVVDSSSKCEEIIVERRVENGDNLTCEKGIEETEAEIIVEEEEEEEGEEEEETLMEDSEGVVVIGDATPDSEKPDADADSPDIITIENDEQNDEQKQPEIIVERTPVGENSPESKESEDEQDQEELSEDVHSGVTVHKSESPIEIETVGDLCGQEFDIEEADTCKETEDNETEKEGELKSDTEKDEEFEQNSVVQDSAVEDSVLKETDSKSLIEVSSREYEIEESSRENSKKDIIKKDTTSKEALKKDTCKEALKKDTVTKEVLKKDTATKEILKKDTATKEVLKKDTATKEVPKKDAASKEVLRIYTASKEVLKKDTATKEIAKKDMASKEVLKKDMITKEVLKKDMATKEVLKKDMVTKEVLKKDTVTREVLKKDPISKEIQKKEVPVKELPVTKRDGLRESSRKNDHSKEMISKKDQKSREIMKKEIAVKDEEVKELQVEEQTVSPINEKSEKQSEEPLKNDSNKDEMKSRTNESLKEELQKVYESSKKPMKEPLKKAVMEKVSVKDVEVSKKDYLKKDKEASIKDVEKDSNIKDVRKDEVSKDLSKKESLIVSKDVNRKEAQSEQDMKKPIPPKEVSKRDLLSPKRDPPVTRKDLSYAKKELPISKKDLPTKDVVKENQSKREMLRRDSKEEITRKEVLKRGLAKEDKKESAKDDMKKRPYIKEIQKSLRKTDGDKTETKVSDIIKSEPVSKIEKNKKESETFKEEGREIKKERLGRESQIKIEEEKIIDQSPKESKIISSNAKGKSVAEDSNKVITPFEKKKDGKEQSKQSEKLEIVPKREIMESSEVKQEKEEKSMKPEKRVLLRSETPSTEDDKTNDAEPPKTVGRKRLAVVNALDSVPNSPASTTDEEREYKSWKKSIMLLYGRLATHKYASLFLRPITDDQAPGYSGVVHRPIDLLTIKKNIETGVIRTTAEFQRDVMLMFLNSIMYNKSCHLVHKMAKQMQQEGMQHIQDYLTTQMLVQVVGDGVPIRRETRTTEANKQRDILGNPTQDETDSAQMPKRKRNVGIDTVERGFKKKKVDE